MRKQSFLGKETGMIKHKRMHWVMAGLVGLPLVGAVSRTQAAEKKFTLTRMVPADVFVCVSARGNPERAFVMDYWGEIFTAAKNSGIGDDLMAMIKEAVGEGDQLDEMNRMKARAMELFNGVDWSALGDGEMVFAERLPPATNQGGNINMGPPDILLIFRGEHAEKNYQGFVNMLTAAVEEISKASQSDYLKLRHETRAGAKIATVDLLTTEQQGLRYNLALAQRDDLIIATIGDRMLDQVLGLIGGESSIANLADNPRFQTAFKQLPTAEDTATFFDMQGMLKPFRQLLGFAVKEMGGAEDVVINARDAGKAFELNAEAVRAYREKDHTRALELVKQAVEADPTDSRVLYNLACFNAVNGNKDAALAALQKSVDAGFYAPALIAKDGDLASLREAPAYQQALAKAKSEVESRGGNEGQIVDRVANRLIDVPGMIDYIATVEYTEGFSLHSKTVVAAVPGVEKNPFYSVVTAKPKFKSYDQFLPQETESFAVSGGVDLVAFYKFVEDTFKLAGPDGERAWSQWVNFQKEADFDIHKNVLDWIGGDMVSVTLEKSPRLGADDPGQRRRGRQGQNVCRGRVPFHQAGRSRQPEPRAGHALGAQVAGAARQAGGVRESVLRHVAPAGGVGRGGGPPDFRGQSRRHRRLPGDGPGQASGDRQKRPGDERGAGARWRIRQRHADRLPHARPTACRGDRHVLDDGRHGHDGDPRSRSPADSLQGPGDDDEADPGGE
jgi:tetratricopeptide (TPR) repeat protein